MSEAKPVTVRILGNDYHVSSPDDQVEKLEEAARFLDKRMQEIKTGGRVMGVERIAVMAALNISYELLHGQHMGEEEAQQFENRITKMQKDIESVLAANAQMPLT